jgi:mannose-1-phosphate guanylyltransferase
MRAMILAAGLGTRLRPLTDERPKPLVPVGDRPAVAHVAAQLAAAGITEAVLNTHHLAAAFTEEILAALPLRLTVVHEDAILGTGGGVANAAPHLGGGDVVVWNGDILAELDLRAMITKHRARGAAATLAVAPRGDDRGTVGLDGEGRIARLRGQRFGEERASGDFLGIYVLSAAFRARLPSPGCLIGDGVMPALGDGARVETFAMPTAWDDVGNLASYLAANARWLARTGRGSFVGEGARVAAGVELQGCVIGAGAEVRGEGALERAVVWPGAIAEAPLADAVVTPRGVVKAS